MLAEVVEDVADLVPADVGASPERDVRHGPWPLIIDPYHHLIIYIAIINPSSID